MTLRLRNHLMLDLSSIVCHMQYYKNSRPTPIPNPRASLSPFLAMTGMVKLTSIRIGSSLGSACSKQEPIAYRYMIPNPTLTEGLRTSLSAFSITLRSNPSAPAPHRYR
jgi:hypothetical protein